MNPLPPGPPIRLLKSQTGLPVNIVDVTYSVCLEFGLLELIEVQINTNDEIDETNTETFWFTENAETLWDQTDMPSELLAIVQDYIKKSHADKSSLLYKTMQQRKEEWKNACNQEVLL
jgi:hypothetical protein